MAGNSWPHFIVLLCREKNHCLHVLSSCCGLLIPATASLSDQNVPAFSDSDGNCSVFLSSPFYLQAAVFYWAHTHTHKTLYYHVQKQLGMLQIFCMLLSLVVCRLVNCDVCVYVGTWILMSGWAHMSMAATGPAVM